MTSDALTCVRNLFRAVEERDLPAVLAAYDPEIVIHEAESLPYGGAYVGHEGARKHAAGYVATWGPFQSHAERQLEPTFHEGADNHIFVIWRQKAVAPDGTRIDLPVISDYLLKNAKIVEARMHHFDTQAIRDFLAEAGRS